MLESLSSHSLGFWRRGISCKIKTQIPTYKINELVCVLYIGVPCSSLILQTSENCWPRSLSWLQLSHAQEAASMGLRFLTYKTGNGAGEKARWLRAFALLVEDPDSGPSIHMVTTAVCNSNSWEARVSFWPSWVHRHTCRIYTHRQANTHTHKIINKYPPPKY